MQYQIRVKSQLHCVDAENVDLYISAEHFAKYGYEYLYITKNGVIVDSVSYHEFVKNGLSKKKRDYITEKNVIEKTGIDEYITTHNEYSRIVVTDNDEFQYEINLMTEPELLHSVERELMTLRALPLFKNEVIEQIKKYKVITVFADDKVREYLQKYLCGINFEFIQNLSEVKVDSIGYILDFRYGKKLLGKIIGEYKKVDIYSIIEKLLISRLINHANKNNLILKMYRIPEYNQISNLTVREKSAVKNKVSFLKIMKDNKYLEEFCLSENNRKFVSARGTSKSIRWDSGMDIMQGECNEFGIEVSKGKRKTSLNAESDKGTVHFFGPCIVFGMMVVNDETIPAYFEKLCKENNIILSVVNHGGLNGNNVINSILGALITPVKKNDVIIIIDFFNDLPYEDYSQVQELCHAFVPVNNKYIRFLDHPVHCNSLANRQIAEYLYKQNSTYFKSNAEDRLSENSVYDKELAELRNFSATHPVAVKTREILKKSVNEKFGTVKGITGAIKITDLIEKRRLGCVISEALKQCDILIVYYAFDHLELSEQSAGISLVEKFTADKRILVKQLSPYFNTHNYDAGGIFENYLCENSNEKKFIESVLIPNHIGVYFFYENLDELTLDEYRNSGIDAEKIL